MPQFGMRQAPGAFFDTDFSAIDDLLAVSVLYGLQSKGDCQGVIVTLSRPNLEVAAFADAVERFYHGPAGNFAQLPPIGMRTQGAPGDTSPAFTAPFQKHKLDGTPVYLKELKSVIDTADPLTLIRNYLEAQRDQASFFILSGPATNLATVLAVPRLKTLIAAKVRLLTVAAGAFPDGPADAGLRADIAAARKLFAEWPTPIVACGAEIGKAIPFPGASIDKEFVESAPDNPVADAYRAYRPMPYDAPSCALAAALYAARPTGGYFHLSGPGRIDVDDQGRTSFTPSEKGTHQYLVADAEQKDKIAQAYIELASAKPPVRRRPPLPQDKTDPAAPPKPPTAPNKK